MAPHLEGHDIAFNVSDRKSWRKYARSIEEYLKRESEVTVGGCVKVVCVGGVMSLFKIKQAYCELILSFTTFVPFFHLILAGHAGKGSLFMGRV